jgi:hypothetical protein
MLSATLAAEDVLMTPVRGVNVMMLRVLVLLLNVPPVIVSLKGYNVLSLYLLSNLVGPPTASSRGRHVHLQYHRRIGLAENATTTFHFRCLHSPKALDS